MRLFGQGLGDPETKPWSAASGELRRYSGKFWGGIGVRSGGRGAPAGLDIHRLTDAGGAVGSL